MWEKDEYGTIEYDFHTVCFTCGGGGVDYDVDTRFTESTNVSGITMMEYVKHKLSLKKKLLSKPKLKDPLLSSAVTDDSALVVEDPSPAEQPALKATPPISIDPPIPDNDDDENWSGVRSEIVGQVQSFC